MNIMTPKDRAASGTPWPDGLTPAPLDATRGSTEPWAAGVVAALAVAIGAHTIAELGLGCGRTSRWLVAALQRMGGGVFHGFDRDASAITETEKTLASVPHDDVAIRCHVGTLPGTLRELGNATIDLVWLDDTHSVAHVATELEALRRIVRVGGIVCGHDVVGHGNVGQAFLDVGGYLVDCPGFAPSHGIGLWQIR